MNAANGNVPLLLIHGAWLSARAAGRTIRDYFSKQATRCRRRNGRAKTATSSRCARRPKRSGASAYQEIVDYYAGLIKDLDQPPVLLGHSFGGLIVQLLLDRGLGRAAVALSPAPPKGILKLPSHAEGEFAPLAHPSKRHGVVALSHEEFSYGFVNTLSPEDAPASYERYYVPETAQIFYEAGFANFHLHPPTEHDFKNGERAPLLIVGAEKDHTVPASVSKAQYKKYEKFPCADGLHRVRRAAAPAHGRARLGRGHRSRGQLAGRHHQGELMAEITDKTDYSRFVRPDDEDEGIWLDHLEIHLVTHPAGQVKRSMSTICPRTM